MTTTDDNLQRMPLTLRLDPWTPTYESAVQLVEEDGVSPADVDPFVETTEWQVMPLNFVNRPRTIAFVDGVQRVEMGVVGDEDGRIVYGAFASVAVGAVFTREGACTVEESSPMRVLALEKTKEPYRTETVACGISSIQFVPKYADGQVPSGRLAVNSVVQHARESLEHELGHELARRKGCELVVVDGRVSPVAPSGENLVVGLAKTIHRHYLQGEHVGILKLLPPKYRTPIFEIKRTGSSLYSWYIRLTQHRPFDHPLSGIVRLETLATIPIEAAVRLADLTACHLPSFASSSMHDARAPQNLYPIGGLETQLRHSLGDHEWIRQHIEVHFAKEYAA